MNDAVRVDFGKHCEFARLAANRNLGLSRRSVRTRGLRLNGSGGESLQPVFSGAEDVFETMSEVCRMCRCGAVGESWRCASLYVEFASRRGRLRLRRASGSDELGATAHGIALRPLVWDAARPALQHYVGASSRNELSNAGRE